MSNLNNNLAKNTDSITANLSRPTTHDASLITGSQGSLNTGLTSGLNQTGLNTGFTTSMPQTTGFTTSMPQTTGLTTGLNQTNLTGFTSNLIPQTGITSNLTGGTSAGNLVPENVNTTLQQEGFGTAGFGQLHGVGTAGQMREDQFLKNTDPNYTNRLTGAHVGTDYHRGIETTGVIDSKFNPTFDPSLQQSNIPKAGMTTTNMQMPIQEPMMTEPHEPEKKQGFLSKLTSHIPIIGKKTETKTASYEEPSGILDEKGTTVGVPGDFTRTSHLGLPVAGPDYTHGTHGLTHDTVFTGGVGSNYVADTSIPMGGQSNMGTMGSNVMGGSNLGMQGTNLTGTHLTGTNAGTGFTGSNLTGSNLGTMGNMGTDQASFGLDYSGTNATHVNRDITLQEGGLLGLRQGAVTANPGDIITNLESTTKTQNMGQTGMTGMTTNSTMGNTGFIGTTGTTNRTLGSDNYYTK